MRQTIRFQPNEPQTVTLESPAGVHVAGRSGPQVRYFLTGNRVVYLDAEPAKLLELLQLQAGESFTVEKKAEPGGKFTWEVARVRQNPPTVTPQAPQIAAQPAKPGTLQHIPPRIPPQPSTTPVVVQRPVPLKATYREAFEQILRDIRHGLSESGEQWSDHCVQAMASTMFIQASRDGNLRFAVPQQQGARDAA